MTLHIQLSIFGNPQLNSHIEVTNTQTFHADGRTIYDVVRDGEPVGIVAHEPNEGAHLLACRALAAVSAQHPQITPTTKATQ